MNLEQKGNSTTEDGSPRSENKISPEKVAIIGELVSIGINTGNQLSFLPDSVLSSKPVLIENIKVKKEALEDLKEDEILNVKENIEFFKKFIANPIFTDDFDLRHDLRRAWETSYIDKGEINPKAKVYYNSNRLNTTQWGSVVGDIEDLCKVIHDKNIKSKLEILKDKIPNEFIDTYDSEDGKIRIYYSLHENDKVKVIKELSKIAEDVVILLEEKIE
jgi:hypothetical protein